jgi:hypothetical protein
MTNSTVDLMLQFVEAEQVIDIAGLLIERVGSSGINGELVAGSNAILAMSY